MPGFRRNLFLMLAGAAGCGLVGAWTGCGSTSNAVRATGPDAFQDALALAQGAIQSPGNRLPAFLTWSTRRGIGDCTTPPNLSADGARLRGTADPRLHNFRQAGGSVPPPGTTTDFGSLGFYYDDLTRKRLCEPAVNVSGTTAPSPLIMSGGAGQWWKSNAMPVDSIDTGFPIGARAGAAIWIKIKRPATPTVQNFQFNVRRGGARATLPVAINISRDVLLRGTAGKTPICDNPLTPPGPAADPVNPDALELSSFYWVQIQTGDLVDQAGCGDLLVLTGFHLIQKTAQGWLWSTYWWDPGSTEFKHLTGLQGAGDTPSVWQPYAVDAAYGPSAVLFNPWKDTETNISNCEFCHVHAVFPAGPQPAGTAPPGSVDLPAHVLKFDFIYGAALAQRP
jgi:hypothetical protein